MAWHDVHMVLVGEGARDVASNFIQRWNHHRDCVQATQNTYLLPKSAKCGLNSPAVQAILGASPTNDTTSQVLSVRFGQKILSAMTASCQVLRSICDWSGGLATDTLENSICQAYLDAIERSQHCIYIENQFFVSMLAGPPVENRIAVALMDRLSRAIRAKDVFRVIIIVPCHPDGRFADNATIQQVMRWQYRTLCRGDGQSMLERLTSEFPDVVISDYFSINSLRQHGFLNGRPVTEQIYVHSKCMIVDDRFAIIGSANINDRSMLATRDSEIAVAVGGFAGVDLDHDGLMNGRPFRVNKFVHELRKKLWAEHLGLEWPHGQFSADQPIHDEAESEHVGSGYNTAAVDLTDPVCELLYEHVWRKSAAMNSNVYSEIFPTAPHKNIPSLAMLQNAERAGASSMVDHERLTHLKGHLVPFAMDFLREEALAKFSLANLDMMFANDTIFT
jgi:phospholipase D1/2